MTGILGPALASFQLAGADRTSIDPGRAVVGCVNTTTPESQVQAKLSISLPGWRADSSRPCELPIFRWWPGSQRTCGKTSLVSTSYGIMFGGVVEVISKA